MRPRPSLWLGALIVLGGLVFLVERLIVTDAEAVEALVERAAEAVREGDFEALAATLAPGFTLEGRSREEAVDWIRTLRRRYQPRGIEVEVEDVAVDGEAATATARAAANVMARPVRFRLTLDCGHVEGEWRIRGAALGPHYP